MAKRKPATEVIPEKKDRKEDLLDKGVEVLEKIDAREEASLKAGRDLPTEDLVKQLGELEKKWVELHFSGPTKVVDDYYASPRTRTALDEKERKEIERDIGRYGKKLEKRYKKDSRQERRAERKGEDAEVVAEEAGDASERGRRGRERVPETAEEVIVLTKERLKKIKEAISKNFADTANVDMTIQRMLDALPPVTPKDLLGGKEQFRAIEVALFAVPDAADTLKAMLREGPESDWYAEAQEMLNGIASPLVEYYQRGRDAREAMEQIESEAIVHGAKNKLKNLANEIAKHPGEALVVLAGLTIALTAAYRWGGSKMQKAMRTVGVIGAVGAGALFTFAGADFIVKGLSDDNKGLFDRLGFHKDTFKESEVMRTLAPVLPEMDLKNTQAFRDMVRLYNTPSSSIYTAFDQAFRYNKKEIDPYIFFSQGHIESSTANAMNGKATYEAIEYVMLMCADRAGAGGSRDEKIQAGMEYFKEHFASGGHDYYFINAMLRLKAASAPSMVNPDGSSAAETGSIEDIPLSQDQLAQKASLIELFEQWDLEDKVDVEHRGEYEGKEYMAINGYPYIYSFDEDTKTHLLDDPFTAEGPFEIKFGKDLGTVLEGMLLDAKAQVKDRFLAQVKDDPVYQSVKTMLRQDLLPTYNKEKGRWYLNPTITTNPYLGIWGQTVSDIPISLYFDHKNTYVFFLLDSYPKDQGKTKFEAVVRDFEKIRLENRVKQDVGHVIGSLNFSIPMKGPDKPVDDPTNQRTTITVEYNGVKGYIYYEAGKVKWMNFSDSPDLKTNQRLIAEQQADHFMETNDMKQARAQLRTAFESHWHKGSAIDKLLKIFTRPQEAVRMRMAERAPLFYGREDNWEEVIDYKMAEYEFMMEMQVSEILNPDLVAAAGATPAYKPYPLTEADYDAAVQSAYRTAATDIEDLKRIAHNIQNLAGMEDGNLMERSLVEEAEKLDIWGYKNKEYIDFVQKVEKDLMQIEGYDYLGGDGLERARGIRDDIRMQLFEYSWPIPSLATLTPDHQKYLQMLYDQLQDALDQAQFNAEGNLIIGGLTLDRRISEAGVSGALDAVGAKPYYEVAGKTSSLYVAVPATPSARHVGGAVSGGPSLSPERLKRKLIEDFNKEVEKEFEYVDDLEWSIVNEYFDAYVEFRKERVRAEFHDLLYATTPWTPQQIYEMKVDDLIAELNQLRTYRRSSGATGFISSLPGLTEADLRTLNNAMEDMTRSMLHPTFNKEWEPQSIKVMNWLNGNFDPEYFYLWNEPSHTTEIMQIYFEKISYGGYETDKKTAEEYTRFFLATLSRQLPIDKSLIDWALDSAPNPRRQITRSEWTGARTAVEEIPSFDEWAVMKKNKQRPELLENDWLFREEERNFELMEEMDYKFLKWYDKEIAIEKKWLVSEGEWPKIHRNSVIRRMQWVRAQNEYPQDYAKELRTMAKFLVMEQLLFEELIKKDISPDQYDPGSLFSMLNGIGIFKNPDIAGTVREEIYQEIDDNFKEYFFRAKSNPTMYNPNTYFDELKKDISGTTNVAKWIDDWTWTVGSITLPTLIPDPFQLTPGIPF